MCSELSKDCIPVEEDENSVWEGSIPQDVMEIILAELPVECILRWRIVCRDWNVLLSSPKFFNRWSENLKRDRWLIVGGSGYFVAYRFSTGKWLTTSTFASPFYGYKGSDLGLFLQEECTPGGRSFSVSNPVTQTSFQLPPVSTLLDNIYSAFIMKGDHGDHYKVALVAWEWNGPIIFQGRYIMLIYDSCEKSWKAAGQIHHLKNPNEIAFSNGLFFFTTLEPVVGVRIMVCSFDCTVINYIPMPENYDFSVPKLVVCGKMLLIAIPVLKMKVIVDIIVWRLKYEMDFQDPSWKEITRVPQVILKKLDSKLKWDQSHCIGFEDCLCIRILGGTDVVEYNLIEGSWRNLSKCPIADRSEVLSSFSIQPNPLLKL